MFCRRKSVMRGREGTRDLAKLPELIRIEFVVHRECPCLDSLLKDDFLSTELHRK